jgi:hypothetical protein
VFRGLKLLRTHYRVNGSGMLVGSEVTLPTNAPIQLPTLLRELRPPLCLLVELILFQFLPSRTMFMGRSIMSQWRKPRKLQT